MTIATAAALTLTANLALAEPIELPFTPASGTNYSDLQTEAYASPTPLTELDTSQVSETVDYNKTYPYVLMSYFAEMYKVSSSKPAKQIALQERLNLLEKAGFSMVTDPAFVPDGLKSLFVEDPTSEEVTERALTVFDENAPKGTPPKKTAKKASLIGGFYHDKSQLKARLFLNPEQKKVVIAIAGTNFGSRTSMESAYSLSSGKVSQAASIARMIATEMQLLYRDYTIELTGASQGGAVAQYAAVEPQINGRAVVFNSQGIHPSITSKWSKSQKQRISHLYLDGELLNGDSYVDYAAQSVIQNKMPVDGLAVPVDPVLETYIKDAYYKASSTVEKARYYFTPRGVMLHWTGSLLEAFEYHADYYHLPSLY